MISGENGQSASRRTFLMGVAGGGGLCGRSWAQTTTAGRLDLHHHFGSPRWIVFGADFPYSTIINHVEGLRKCGFTPEELRGIDRENALRFLPRTMPG
jgi:hypothetical protein